MKHSLTLALVFSAMACTASAETLVDQVTEQLASQGYSEITVSKTWLGRVRIEASGGTASREIIINPRTGEILRDYWEDEDGEGPGLLATRRGGTSGEEDEAGVDDAEEDDAPEDDEEADEEEDDDEEDEEEDDDEEEDEEEDEDDEGEGDD